MGVNKSNIGDDCAYETIILTFRVDPTLSNFNQVGEISNFNGKRICDSWRTHNFGHMNRESMSVKSAKKNVEGIHFSFSPSSFFFNQLLLSLSPLPHLLLLLSRKTLIHYELESKSTDQIWDFLNLTKFNNLG